MDLNPKRVLEILKSKGILNLYHANSVKTASTFLSKGYLFSRGYVEKHGLFQTPQWSDDLDKFFGIWEAQFFDFVDIHSRGRKRNCYGPVLFAIKRELLLDPNIKKVRVSKLNPIKWKKSMSHSEKYFMSESELKNSLSYGTFDQSLIIPDLEKIHLGSYLKYIRLDSILGNASYAKIQRTLSEATTESGLRIKIFPRECAIHCNCKRDYSSPKTKVRELLATF